MSENSRFTDEILRKNENDANRVVAKVMVITLFIFSFIYILNILNIFIIDQTSMNFAFLISAGILLAPTFINKIVTKNTRCLKYIYIILSNLFIFVISSIITYHAVIVYIYPILVAGVYFNKKLTWISTITTCITTVIGQIVGFNLNLLNDANFPDFLSLILFSILPKLLSLISIACIVILLTKRTEELIKNQIKGTDEIKELNNDMIIGFVTLVENKDESTGGHIKRTSLYAERLAQEMRNAGLYQEELTDQFIENLKNAAPMHDIGKIGIPDYILQKPGKLTEEEYEIMKTHSEKGGEILQKTFNHVGDESFRETAFEVARHHHEKWNGKGYPDHLSGTNIPLAARIMSIADVFDAISEKRCYREAMPIEHCFDIIQKGRGEDFEAELVDIFLGLKPEIEKIRIEMQ